MKFNKLSTKMKKIYNFFKRKKQQKNKKKTIKNQNQKKKDSPIKNAYIFDKTKQFHKM